MAESLGGPAPVHANPTDTELEAKGKAENDIGRFRRIVLEFVRDRGEHGATGDELYQHFQYDMFLQDRTESSVRTRLTELYNKYNLIFPSRFRRKNSRGNSEIVWLDKAYMNENTLDTSRQGKVKLGFHYVDGMTTYQRRERIIQMENQKAALLARLRIIGKTMCMCGDWEFCPRCLALDAIRSAGDT